jgi:protein-disulfide isomerase
MQPARRTARASRLDRPSIHEDLYTRTSGGWPAFRAVLWCSMMTRLVLPLWSVLCACATGPPLTASEDRASRQLMRVAEVDPARVAPALRRRLLRLAEQGRCPCASQGRLADCLHARRCLRARFAVRALLRGVVRGVPDQELDALQRQRFGGGAPASIAIDHAPCRGEVSAPVALVVFSDFACPYCRLGRTLVELLERAAGRRLRVCFKHYPLVERHADARLAAQATVAADLQRRFWPMHDRLFDNPQRLGRQHLLEHARAVGLDVERFRRDLDSLVARGRVEGDRAEAIALGVPGTPTFFINGRRMTDPKTIPDFLDWIAEAIALPPSPASQPAR